MTIETHFNVKDIEYIRITPVKELNYKWYDYEPPIKTFFGLWTKRREQKPGWCDRGGVILERYNRYYDIYEDGRKTTDQLLKNNLIFVEENVDGKQWFEKAKVYIQKRNSYYTNHFDTNEEAIAWVEKIKGLTNDKFEIIINK